ncbi:MAG: hypothetical protein QGF78_07300, partial [Candidatus Bathyarchaeota archaeon]|nr:hypothetical protein [Candidatus Bathyarchaeota archaeon]
WLQVSGKETLVGITTQEFVSIIDEEKARVLNDNSLSSQASIALTHAMWLPLIQHLNDVRTNEYSLAEILEHVGSNDVKDLLRSGAEDYLRTGE